ncbi:MAG: hypothetical protein D6722_10850, partial [Bacteroidetes bacterium]
MPHLGAQVVEHVRPDQRGDSVYVYYDLTGCQPGDSFFVSLFVSLNGGASYQGPKEMVAGDVGPGQVGGQDKCIRWAAQQEIGRLSVAEIRFKVEVRQTHSLDPDVLAALTGSFVKVEGGTFVMGDLFGDGLDGDEYLDTITVSTFWLGANEVTWASFSAFCGATGRALPEETGWGTGPHPIVNVSWYDAVAFCNWLSRTTGLTPVYTIEGEVVTADWQANGYRLPTEAEWE